MASRRRGGSRKRGAEEIGGAGGCSSSTEDPWSTLFTWRIENFSKQRSELVRSDCFEAGICTWRLRAYPGGDQGGQGSHLSALLEVQDGMWNPKVEIKLTLVNQADASKSITDVHSGARKSTTLGWGVAKFLELTALRNAAAGWLVNDALVLTVDVTVEREDRFHLDTGAASLPESDPAVLPGRGVPCDVTLKLPSGVEVPAVSQLLQMASPFFRDALEDVSGSALIPVDGSLGAWTYILSDLYPLPDATGLTLGSVYVLLPVAHKYNFTKLLKRLVAFVKERSKALLGGITKQKLQTAITVEVEVGSGADKQTKRVIWEEVMLLSHELLGEVLSIAATYQPPAAAAVAAAAPAAVAAGQPLAD
ncbi:hypothetical protein FOA52_012718 [Chlamydomonas sp. UWO 241]|nr:hypothetical protein FOA52_012718 [Chlamydomonas sp. UWO 241]